MDGQVGGGWEKGMDEWIARSMHGWLVEQIDGWVHEWTDALWIDGRMDCWMKEGGKWSMDELLHREA